MRILLFILIILMFTGCATTRSYKVKGIIGEGQAVVHDENHLLKPGDRLFPTELHCRPRTSRRNKSSSCSSITVGTAEVISSDQGRDSIVKVEPPRILVEGLKLYTEPQD